MRIAVCQLNARDDRDANLAAARRLLEAAADRGADLAVLPEYVDHLGPNPPRPEPVDGDFGQFFADAARELGMWVHAGSFHEVGPDAQHTYNTSLLFDRSGNLAATYRKIHLYDVEIPGRVSYHESATVAPGSEVVTAEVEGATLGLSICYDLRFPELYRKLTDAGANVLVVQRMSDVQRASDVGWGNDDGVRRLATRGIRLKITIFHPLLIASRLDIGRRVLSRQILGIRSHPKKFT